MKDNKEIPENKEKEEKKAEEILPELNEVERLKKYLEQKTKEAGEYQDSLLRARAEFENFRRRTEKEKQDLFKFSQEPLIKELLSVIDNFELALNSAKESKDFINFHQGVEMIYKNLKKILEKEGVTEIQAIGNKVDPLQHDVVSHDPDGHDEIVVEVLRKGYMLSDKVMRPAMVKVGKKAKEEKPKEKKEETKEKQKEE